MVYTGLPDELYVEVLECICALYIIRCMLIEKKRKSKVYAEKSRSTHFCF